MSDRPISQLRQRMIDDMTLRKLGDKTQSTYIRAVRFDQERAPQATARTVADNKPPNPHSAVTTAIAVSSPEACPSPAPT